MDSNQTARRGQASMGTELSGMALYVAFELSRAKWKLALSDGSARAARIVTLDAGALERVQTELDKAKRRFGLASSAEVHSCYEAGREGFWLHRALESLGVANVVVDAASIEVNRRKRRTKTDRLDAQKLVSQLVRHHRGERVWSVVRVPSVRDEDDRQLNRELSQLRKERKQHRVRIQSLLFAQGVDLKVGRGFVESLQKLRLYDGRELACALKQRLLREHARLEQVQTQIRELEQHRKQALKQPQGQRKLQMVVRMSQLCGIGTDSAWTFTMELFGWRQFDNRRQVGGALGLSPTHYTSGSREHEQGISKAGHGSVRWLAVQIAWSWIRYQPQSKLSRWFAERFAHGGSKQRRIGIIGVARRLMIELWRFVDRGQVPEGARFKLAS